MADPKVYPKANRFRFPPIKAQTKQLLLGCPGALHFAYNHALDLISTAWRERPGRKTHVNASKEITALKETPSIETLLEAWEAAEAETERWLSAQYDGLLGDPPVWVPVQMRMRFHGLRSHLLAKYGETQARRWFVLRDHRGDGEFVPFEVRAAVDELVRIWRLAGLGEAEGLSAFLGEGMASALCAGRKASDGGRKGHKKAHGTAEEKEGRWQGYQAAIDKLYKDFPQYSHNKLCEIVAVDLKVGVSTLRLRTKKPPHSGEQQRC